MHFKIFFGFLYLSLPSVDAVTTEWSDYNNCSELCGPGNQTRTRQCTPAKHGGDPCPDVLEETQDCEINVNQCPRKLLILYFEIIASINPKTEYMFQC